MPRDHIQDILRTLVDGEFILIRLGKQVEQPGTDVPAQPVVLSVSEGLDDEQTVYLIARIAASLIQDGYRITPDVKEALDGTLIQSPAGG